MNTFKKGIKYKKRKNKNQIIWLTKNLLFSQKIGNYATKLEKQMPSFCSITKEEQRKKI